MAKYTVSFLELAESQSREILGYSDLTSGIEHLRKYLFDFPYSLYRPGHKIEFETKFIRHFLMREIGVETPALFKVFLQERLLSILPYYNQLYKLNELLENLNILTDRDMRREEEGKEERDRDDNRSKSRETVDEERADNTSERKTTSEEGERNTANMDEQTTGTDTGTNDTLTTGRKEEEHKEQMLHEGNTEETGMEETRQHEKQISESNAAASDFPQANIYGQNNQYYSTGSEGNGQNERELASGSATGKETGESSTEEKNANAFVDETTSVEGNTKTVTDRNVSRNDYGETEREREEHGSISDKRAIERQVAEQEAEIAKVLEQIGRKHKSREYGLSGRLSPMELVEQYRNNWMNVDLMIFEECRDLFMQIY